MEDEVPENQLKLEEKRQRSVRVEMDLVGFLPYRDMDPQRRGHDLIGVFFAGDPSTPTVKKGEKVRAMWYVNRPLDGATMLHHCALWILGEEEGKDRGEEAWVPPEIGEIIMIAT